MDLTPIVDDIRTVIARAPAVTPVGARTQWEVGGDLDVPDAVEVRVPEGIVRHDPADLTVTVLAGTPVRRLADTLAEEGQECPLDPRDPAATVGGLLACGLSGPRRLLHGPLRDRVLEVQFVTGDGRSVKGGGPTVKNVTGYDLPRLLVGSLGTLGVLVQVTLRCQPRPRARAWLRGVDDPFALRARLYRPACVAWNGSEVWCLVEGHDDDVVAEQARSGLAASEPPPWPSGPYRGRISLRPSSVLDLTSQLDTVDGVTWIAEVGVGTVHVAAQSAEPLARSRTLASGLGGWMVREAGSDLDGFGTTGAAPEVGVRLRRAFDPAAKLNPGRMPR